MRKRSTLSAEKQRLKFFLWLLIKKYQPNCWLCNQPFVYDDVLPSRGVDQLTEHHICGDHMCALLEHRVLVHRTCHKSHHAKDNINKGR